MSEQPPAPSPEEPGAEQGDARARPADDRSTESGTRGHGVEVAMGVIAVVVAVVVLGSLLLGGGDPDVDDGPGEVRLDVEIEGSEDPDEDGGETGAENAGTSDDDAGTRDEGSAPPDVDAEDGGADEPERDSDEPGGAATG